MQSESLRHITSIFEPQLRAPKRQMCGAAALAMAYRSFDIQCDQAELDPAIARVHQGVFRAGTRELAAHAIGIGLNAAIVQTHRPWQTLQQCWTNGLVTILNHRVHLDSAEGHYSVLAGIDQHSIRINDPLKGPDVKIPKKQFLELWLPNTGHANVEGVSSISGNVFVALGSPDFEPDVFSHCGVCLPIQSRCSNCDKQIPLRPVIAIGCAMPSCRSRNWYRIFCPHCDHSTKAIR